MTGKSEKETGDLARMKPDEVKKIREETPHPQEPMPGGDGDANMADDLHPEEWDEEWRPGDAAASE